MSLILSLFVALMLPGVVVRTRALLSGRKGAPFFQHITRLGVLMHKAPMYDNRIGVSFGSGGLFGFDFGGLVVGPSGGLSGGDLV